MKCFSKVVLVGVVTSFIHAATLAQSFTQQDLEKMVAEMTPYLPQDPRLSYPVKCTVVDKEDVNAYASVYVDPAKKETKPQASMTVFTGLFKHMKEVRLVRAVVAHELAHLSKQHLGKTVNANDLDLLFTRQQEFEADSFGAAVLEKAGYSQKDMRDMLKRLGDLEQKLPGSIKVMGDHADCARRAAAIEKNNNVLRSMVSFVNGEAYMDTRDYLKAMQAFDKASAQEPSFYESKYNAARAALLNYYDRLADKTKESWYIPDFGPSLLMPLSTDRAPVLTDGDRANYELAVERMNAVVKLNPNRSESKELQGTVLILDPDGKPDSIAAGINALTEAAKTAGTPAAKLRIANNIAVGHQRGGNLAKAVETMLIEQRTSKLYNPNIAVNLGSQSLDAKFKGDAGIAEAVLYTYLTRTSSASRGYQKTLANYQKVCADFGYKAREIKDSPINLCRVLSLSDGTNTYSLFDSAFDIVKLLKKAENGTRYSEDYEGLMELSWKNGQFAVLTEQSRVADEYDLDVVRITSYIPGSYVDLKPIDTKINFSFRISVGMAQTEFAKVLDPAAGVQRALVKMSSLENWTYYPGLNLGVLLKDGKVSAITVSPSSNSR